MSVTFNMVGSGGVNVVALIVANYPEGATCTATCNGITLTADSGTKYVFQIPFLGTWVVTADLNGVTQTENVVISAYGAVESVMLYPYTETTYLYDQGNEYTSRTGGWTVFGIKNADNIKLAKNGDAITQGYVPIANYLALMVEVKSESPGIIQRRFPQPTINVNTATEYKKCFFNVQGLNVASNVAVLCVESTCYIKTIALVR